MNIYSIYVISKELRWEAEKLLVWLGSSSKSLCMQGNSTARINQEYLVKISFISYKGSFVSAASTDDSSKK